MNLWSSINSKLCHSTTGTLVSWEFLVSSEGMKQGFFHWASRGIGVMDLQNLFFLDILQGKEQGFESFDNSILISQRRNNFTVDENIKLESAWLNVSLDAMTSTDQKTQHCGIEFDPPSTMTRNLTVLSRWLTIQRETNKFCGYLAQIENRNESGKTEHDKINDVKIMYKSNSKNAFQLEHCWRILMNEAK
ncbi:hypothetical protein CFP56_000605 [Quercus suber]|uniref:Uncharacterized protein n=1 Tax=Quercus suber TaxID=58331 RepID=A0AAW0IPV0_QUESU